MKKQRKVLCFGGLLSLILFLAYGCGSQPQVKVVSVARTEGMDIERAAEGKVFLVVELDSGQDLGSDLAFSAFLDACRLTDQEGGNYGNPGQKYDRAKNPALIKLWWNVPKEKTAFVLVYGKQRIQLDVSLSVVPYAPALSPEVKSAETPGEIVASAKEKADGPVRVIGTMKTPKLLKKVEPVYPDIARQARVQGTVVVKVTTDNQGKVVDTEVMKSIPLLDSAVIDAVRQWVYEPMIIDGRPRGAILIVTFQCTLNKK